MLFRKIHIRQHERGVWFRDGDFRRLLEPGAHRLWAAPWAGPRDVILPADTLATRFDHALLDMMLAQPHVRDALHVVDLTDVERALVWKDERLAYVLGPGRHAFWKTPYRLCVETFRAGAGGDFWFQHPRLRAVLGHPAAATWLDCVRVDAGAEGLLFRDGVLTDRLAPGLHAFWKGTADVSCRAIDLREQAADVTGRETVTADGVPVRVNLLVTYRVTDAALAACAVGDYGQALYRETQHALRTAIGSRTLAALLADRLSIGEELCARLSTRAADFGLGVRHVGLRDVLLPGDVRSVLVEAATAVAAAGVRRRVPADALRTSRVSGACVPAGDGGALPE